MNLALHGSSFIFRVGNVKVIVFGVASFKVYLFTLSPLKTIFFAGEKSFQVVFTKKDCAIITLVIKRNQSE